MYVTSNQTVYFGPSSYHYPVVGTVYPSDTIECLWEDGEWYYIQYPLTSGGFKRGYVSSDVVMMVSADSPAPRAFSELCSGAGTQSIRGGGPTYYGPDTSIYPTAGSVDDQEDVYYLGYSENGFDLIEYNVNGTNQKKRAYFPGGFGTYAPIDTQMSSSQAVLSGPSNSNGVYHTMGFVSAGQSVKAIIVSEDSQWVQIEYYDHTFSTNIRGYVPVYSTRLTSIHTLPRSKRNGYFKVENNGAFYAGPSSTLYENLGTLTAESFVVDLGYGENDYQLIEFSASGSANKKRGYVPVQNLLEGMAAYTTYKDDDIIPTSLPMAMAEITQGFNDKTTGSKGHLGYDMLPTGGFIRPLFDGVIKVVRDYAGEANGLVICVEHNINGYTFYTDYCHLSSVSVYSGPVTTDTVIGIMGGSGVTEGSYSPHLHVCVYRGEFTLDPSGYGSDEHNEYLETSSDGQYNGYYYGPNDSIHPRCYNRRFYDPYGVVTSNAAVIALYP